MSLVSRPDELCCSAVDPLHTATALTPFFWLSLSRYEYAADSPASGLNREWIGHIHDSVAAIAVATHYPAHQYKLPRYSSTPFDQAGSPLLPYS